MADLLTTLAERPLLTDGGMGSLLYQRTGRVSEANHVYEAFNVDKPDLVAAVHRNYLEAGARCIKANTFGAHREQLDAQGLGHRVAELNRAGVQLARDCVAEFADDGPHFVLASIGPCGPKADIRKTYEEQVRALIDAQPDALVLETFERVDQLLELIALIAENPQAPPIVAQVSVKSEADHSLHPEPCEFVARMAKAGVPVVGVNCCTPWDAEAFIKIARELPEVSEGRVQLAAMPNGGGFQRIGNRFMSSINPEAMGKLAREMAQLGARLIGGCCEVHPEHIREMRNYLLASKGGSHKASRLEVCDAESAGPKEKRGNGAFSRKLVDAEFAVSVEILPPRGTSPALIEHKLEFVRELAASGLADGLDITDGSRGIPLMPPGDFSQLIRLRLGWQAGDGLELIPHFTARDLNLMGIQSRLIGYHWAEIHNVLFITGDPPKMSPSYPRSTAVFDLDSAEMVHYTHAGLNSGRDFGGAPLAKNDPATHFTIGTGFEPEALDMNAEMTKLQRKIANGADYVMTQPAFRFEPLDCLAPYRDRVPIIVGVMILTSFAHAQRVADVPGVVLPDSILQRLERYPQVADQAKVGRDFAIEQSRRVRAEGWAGLYLMSPSSHKPVLEVLAGAAD
jgi:methionine synthase I (cobalamin-dependent)/5,10-methylenetetrahydrofolate reductase